MAIPLAVTEAPLEAPFASPALVTAELPGIAVEPAGYFGGTASGTSLSYDDVSDFVWFALFDWDAIVSGSRIRSSFEVTLGRTLVGTPQADVSASETFPRAEALNVGDLIAYPTMIRPLRPIALLRAIEDGGGLPIYEQRLSYETRLAALSRMYPPSLFATTLEAIGTPTATAQEVLQHLFDLWAQIFPEFRAKPVPPLVLFAPDETGAYTRTLTTDRIYLKQPEGRERSIQTLLEDFRAIFVGYGVSVDAEGDLVIIPPPWAETFARPMIADPAYRRGPGWVVDLDTLGAGTREDVGSSAWAIDPTFDEDQLEVDVTIHQRLSESPTGPRSLSAELSYSGVQAASSVRLVPGVPVEVTRELVPFLGLGGFGPSSIATYRLTWTRPGPTGGSIAVELVTATLSFVRPALFMLPATTLYVGHGLTLDAYAVGEIGIRTVTVSGDDLETPVPAPALDGSRVINRQEASYADVDFVEDTPLLPSFSTRAGATTYTAPGTAYTPPSTFHPFVDEDDEPLLVGETVTISFDYQLRRARNAAGLDEEDRDGFVRSETFDLRPGETRSFTYNLAGEVPLTSGFLVTVRFRYTSRDGIPGLVVDIPSWASRSTNVLLTRPWFGHVLAWDTVGSVYGPTGEELEVIYDETSGDADVLTSQALYGVRAGPPIEVNFFRVTYQDLLDVTQAIVRYNMAPRARYVGVKLTPASEITPDDLGKRLLLPFGIAAVLEAYSYDDARSFESSRTSRSLDLVLLFPLVDGAGSFAGATDAGTIGETAGIDGQSVILSGDV